MTWARRCAVAAVVVIASTSLTACGGAGDPTRGWDEPSDYSVTIRYQAYDIDAGTYRIIVHDHVPTTFIRVDHRGDFFLEEGAPDLEYFTLRQIVGRYQTALAHIDAVKTIDFDDQGMPTHVYIDWEPYRITDEQTWTITDLVIHQP